MREKVTRPNTGHFLVILEKSMFTVFCSADSDEKLKIVG